MDRHSRTSYPRFIAMVIVSFLLMYVFMYAMADKIENIYPKLNQFYMAGLMASLMAAVEITVMSPMYGDRRINTAIAFFGVLMTIVFFSAIRLQTAVKDEEFLKSMIPHHAAAILMCEKTKIENPKIQSLCENIISNQKKEIEEMKIILENLESFQSR
jgi:uncharacterized protein (DUF305 family)